MVFVTATDDQAKTFFSFSLDDATHAQGFQGRLKTRRAPGILSGLQQQIWAAETSSHWT
ncbi:mCG1028631 [Mus musculus]|nr:mCG1028631 [Mus musculus]